MSLQEKKKIYLDNAATTQMSEVVKAAMEPYMREYFGNASTVYEYGREAKKALEEAREVIAQTIHAKAGEIYFTSGGTESDNWAIKGMVGNLKKRGKHMITSRIEHHAVLNSCKYLEKLGYEVTYLSVNQDGLISIDELKREIRSDTTFISVMYGNNEIGTIEPLTEIGQLVKKYGIVFHTDAVQAYAQVPISVKTGTFDMLSASAHKFHGPKGVGFLYVREGVELPSYIHGGGQERGKRAGTENVAAIVGMAQAASQAHKNLRQKMHYESMLRNYMIEKIYHEIPGVKLNGHRTRRLPGNINISFAGVDGATLLQLLEEEGICASGGSACNTGEERISYVIAAIRVPEDYATGTIRMSLCEDTTREEIDKTIESLKRNVLMLRDS